MPREVPTVRATQALHVSLLTGGGDRPYALGLAGALAAQGVRLDFIGSDALVSSELLGTPQVNFLNLRGDQSPDVSFVKKVSRVLTYYGRLIHYAARAKSKVFHILWNDKFEVFDRTVLMLYYRALGKRIVLTVHNVNTGERDANDTYLNRCSLRLQYTLADHIFVHTAKMKSQLADEFGVLTSRISVVPLGINNSLRVSDLTTAEAKRRLGIGAEERALLFFGRIAPYKGLEYLITALADISRTDGSHRLIIAGSIGDWSEYWHEVQQGISRGGVRERIIERIEFIPDDETELYFKAADVLVLPYSHIFQSGVLVLAYSFGLPVIASDVGSLREDIVEGRTGYTFRPKDTEDLARAIREYFDSDLYRNLERRRQEIKAYATERYSWAKVGETTRKVYASLCNG